MRATAARWFPRRIALEVAPSDRLAADHDGPAPMRALQHYADAARSALNLFAPREAADLTAHALTLLPRCPEGPERLELELVLVSCRGVACSQQFGLAAPEAQVAYERAQQG